MKHFGSKMEYSRERVRDLMRAYKEYISSCRYIIMSDAYKTIVNMPSARFWVSDIRASLVVSAIIRGEKTLETMWPLRREMYTEIYHRVLTLQKQQPHSSILELCSQVVSSPAPKFYLTAGTAKILICKAKKQCKKENLKP